MKAYAIVIKDHEISEFGYTNLVNSSKKVNNGFSIERWDATVPSEVDPQMQQLQLTWNYPWSGQVSDFATGLVKSAYVTANPKSRIAAAISHYRLWQRCLEDNQPHLVLEHDAVFKSKIDFDAKDIKFDILGINNPLGCTRKSRTFYQKIVEQQLKFMPAPLIDDSTIPQGLAGNSAYIIKPQGAEQLINAVKQYGLWPNDAIMCRQLIKRLGVTGKFYTHIQNLKSTTTQ